MILRGFIFLIGFGLAIIGGVSTIAYLNLLTTGYKFYEYLHFISRKIECYLLIIGLLMVWISIYFPTKEQD
ncbi:hypothetical protein MJG50_12820 [Fredinandcohnia sp. SECRCQ15]|uniref:Uncharacterized protein n=1 Tax=Fredinandcohnia quinoae TaxID=2918902 RepID=A0AAW5E9Y5_9BACI|nr:hypothetical protein [Fredinandcohnia sp. SECRCQ15]MCH1626216.1 hypothetical protein [Fredinandcohnia sp. SECRCQ15]